MLLLSVRPSRSTPSFPAPRKPKTFHLRPSRKLQSQRRPQQRRFHHGGVAVAGVRYPHNGWSKRFEICSYKIIENRIISIVKSYKNDKIIKLILRYFRPNMSSPLWVHCSILSAGPHRHSPCPSSASISSFRSLRRGGATGGFKWVCPIGELTQFTLW